MVSGHLAVKKNRWYAILCLRHPDGRRYDKWIATGLSYPGNKRKAEAMLIELRRQHFNSHIWNAATLLSEYIPDWLKTRQKEISETTYSSYLQIANEIVRYFLNQDVRLSQISPHHIETYYQTLYERGLKSNSVLHHHALLHKALADASRKGLIAENPMEKVQRPAKGSYIPHPYTAEEMKTLFAALQGHYMEVPIKLAAYYGLRRSEVLGLRWQAIDFEQETISVEHTWSVCFSENGFNEVLWLKYADQHRGFVQIYDLENNDNFLCGKQEKCANCGIKNYGTPLYPIYYSDTPYDATKFAKFVMLRKIAETTATQIPPELYAGMGSALWEQERTTLIKKECHKYDEEWRMITGCIMKPPVMMEWIPSGIILGLRMGVAEENLVVSMAKEAGIKNIYKSYINAQNKLDAYPLKL